MCVQFDFVCPRNTNAMDKKYVWREKEELKNWLIWFFHFLCNFRFLRFGSFVFFFCFSSAILFDDEKWSETMKNISNARPFPSPKTLSKHTSKQDNNSRIIGKAFLIFLLFHSLSFLMLLKFTIGFCVSLIFTRTNLRVCT